MNTIRKLFPYVSVHLNLVRHASRQHAPTRKKQKIPSWKETPNPGVDLRLSALGLDAKEVAENPELLEESEIDFQHADKFYDIYQKEKKQHRFDLSVFQVKRKHFKEERLPNMLLWEEKEQIRLLHKEDPGTWNVESLAKSFPASVHIIKKILRSKWKMQDAENVLKHDAKVKQNWDNLKTGKLDISDEELKEHLISFSRRKRVPPLTFVPEPPVLEITEDTKGSFTQILKTYEKATGKLVYTTIRGPQNTFLLSGKDPEDNEESKLKSRYPSRLATLENLKARVLVAESKNKNCTNRLNEHAKAEFAPVKDPIGCLPEEKIESTSLDEENCDTTHSPSSDEAESKNSAHISNEVSLKNKKELEGEENDSSLTNIAPSIIALKNTVSDFDYNYPMKINIPENVWKKGTLYKFRDCFYTDDGKFLYRVPGMLN